MAERMKKNKKPPTMVDVANLAGVSTMTVSRALKPDTSVNEKTRTQIQEAAEKLGYVLNTNAASFSSHKTGFVAVTIPSINNANFAETLSILTERLRAADLQILLGNSNYSVAEEERLVEQFLQRRPEAIIVTGGAHTERCRRLLINSGVPVVEMWDMPKDPIDEFVGFSNAAAASLMVDHFTDLGHTKIGFIGGDDTQDTRGLDRRRGFVRRLKEKGLASDRMVSTGIPPVSMRQGANAIKRLLEKWPDTQAVMCVSDLSAFGAVSYCVRNNIAVPGKIAIAGFGAYDISEMSNPPLTTIDVGAQLIGAAAAETVIRRLRSNSAEIVQLQKPQIVVRGSTLQT